MIRKRMSKIISIFLLSIVLFINLNVFSYAKNDGDFVGKLMLNAPKKSPRLLVRNGIVLYSPVITAKIGNNKYYAYCLEQDKKGPEIIGDYEIDIQREIDDKRIYVALLNGYPNKSLKELGVESEDEAYTATKQAVYAMLNNWDMSQYNLIGDAGRRTYNALEKILQNARRDLKKDFSRDVTLDTLSDWQYISEKKILQKKIKVSSKFNGIVSLKADDFVKIRNEKGKIINEIKTNSNILLEIGLKNLDKKGKVTLSASAKLTTMPILYGITKNAIAQNFALAGFKTRGETNALKEYYYDQNNTKIEILKIDGKDKKPISGVRFRLMDKSKKKILDLETDVNGRIVFTNLLPDTYYIKEIKERPGYAKLKDEKEIKLDFQYVAKIKVENNKIINKEYERGVTKYTYTTKKIGHKTRYSEKNIKYVLPYTGM